MTFANYITIGRLILIPVFIGFAIAHGLGLKSGTAYPVYHFAATLTFILAAASDAFDGWIARNFDQQSELGARLDPVADKLLLLAGVIVLSTSGWVAPLPLWFGVLVVTRDVLIIIGYFVVRRFAGTVKMGPHWTSKVCTVLQMSCVAWILLDFRHVPVSPNWLIYAAAAFTLISAVAYYREAQRQISNR